MISFGAVAIISGLQDLGAGVAVAILAGGGLLLLAGGIGMRRWPRPSWIALAGIGLVTMGALNIAALVAIAEAHTGEIGVWDKIWAKTAVMLSISQIILGVQRMVAYRRFRGLSLVPPSEEQLSALQEMMKGVASADPEQSEDILVLEADDPWKARLGTEAAVFVQGEGAEILVAAREDVVLHKVRTFPLMKSLIATFRIRNRRIRVRILPEHLRRFERWKMRD
jgi:hypothetical protein